MSEHYSSIVPEHHRQLDFGRLAATAALALAGAALFFALFAAWETARTPFAGFFTGPTLIVNGLGDPDWPGYASGLGFPQRVVSVDDRSLNRPTALLEALSAYQPGDTVLVRARDPFSQMETTAQVRLIPFPLNAGLSYFALPYLLAWLLLIVGVWALRSAPPGEAALVFVGLCASLTLVAGLFFDVFTTHYLWWLWLFSVPVTGSLALHFALVFPERIDIVDRARGLLLLVYLPGLVASIVAVAATTQWSAPTVYFAPWFWGMAWTGFSALGLVALMALRRFLSPSPLIQAHARTILWGTLLGFGPYVAWAASTLWSNLRFSPTLVFPWMALFPFSIAHTLLRRRALDIDWILRRAVVHVLLTVVVVIGFLLVFVGVSWFAGMDVSPAHPVVLVTFALLIVVGIQPVRMGIQGLVDRVVLGRRARPEQASREFSADVAVARTEEQVARTLGKTLERALAPRCAFLYLLDEQTGQYTPHLLCGETSARPRFRMDDPLALRLADSSQFLYLAGAAELPPELEPDRERLARLGPTLFVPLFRRGWLAVGPTRLRRFRAADVRFLEAIGPQLVAALERVHLITNLERRVAELETLRRIAQSAGYSVELDDLLELIYAQTSRVLDTTNFYIALHDSETRTFRFAIYVDGGERRYSDDIWSDTHGLTGVIIRTGRPIVTDDYLAECRRQGVKPGGKPGTAWMGMPLISRDQVVDVINISSVDPEVVYTWEQVEVFQAIADQVAAILDRTRLYQEMERRARQLEALNEVGNVITSTLELPVVLDLIMQKAIELLRAAAGSLLLVDEERGDLVFQVAEGPRTSDLVGTRLPMDTGIVGQVAREAKPVIVDDVRHDERWYPGLDERSEFITRSVICVPMIARGRVIGVIELLNRQNGKPFDREDQRLLAAFAANAAVAIENARLFTMTDAALAARVEELSMMQRIDRELNATLDYRRVMEITLDWALRTTGADEGLLAVVPEPEAETQGLRLLAHRGYEERESEGEFWPPVEGQIARALHSGEPQLVTWSEETADGTPLDPNMAAQLVVPIRREEQIVGVIVLESADGESLDRDALGFVARLADHAAMAIENARLFQAVQRVNEAKTEFVSFVSHELKQPMTSIRGYADLLMKGTVGELTEAQRPLLEVIRANVSRMDTLVQDLLDISRIEAGRLKLEIQAVALEDVVAEVVHIIERQVEAKEQTLEVQIQEPVPPVSADRNRLVQILMNLLTNAHKYTLEGGQIRIVVGPQERDFVFCSVSDTGIGMSEEEQERLFTKFFRSQNRLVRNVSGTGLGLVITKSLVELLGGKIWVESASGRGSTFTFSVPVAER